MPKGYKINYEPHGDILAWIVQFNMWVILGHYQGKTPPARARGAYITKPHDTACANYFPSQRPRRDEQAMTAQREVQEDPELAAEVERLWRERSTKPMYDNDGTKG